MSYEIVKTISIKEGKVFINCASNNVIPHNYRNEEYPSFSKILQEKGLQEVEIQLLKNYEEGNLQGGSNKYTRALKVLYYVLGKEYKPFDWRNNGEEYEKAKVLRETPEFRALLLKALNTKMPKEKFIVYCSSNGGYIKKETSRHIFYGSKEEAKEYDFKEQAEKLVTAFKERGYEVIQI